MPYLMAFPLLFGNFIGKITGLPPLVSGSVQVVFWKEWQF